MHRTLLLADDSVVSQKLVGLAFANQDVSLEIVPNGDEAHRRIRELRPDLVLADLGIPGANAYELCEVIKRDPRTAHVAVVLLAGEAGVIDAEKARRAGCDAHLVKPLNTQALVRTVDEVLGRPPQLPPPEAESPAPGLAADAGAATAESGIGAAGEELEFGPVEDDFEPLPIDEALDLDAAPPTRLDWLRPESNAAPAKAPLVNPIDAVSSADRERIHLALEKAAADALSQLSDGLVDSLVDRVERIAWEVIPQLTEILVREALSKSLAEPVPDGPEAAGGA